MLKHLPTSSEICLKGWIYVKGNISRPLDCWGWTWHQRLAILHYYRSCAPLGWSGIWGNVVWSLLLLVWHHHFNIFHIRFLWCVVQCPSCVLVFVISPNMDSLCNLDIPYIAPQLVGNIWMDQGKHVVFGEVLEGLEASWSFNPWKLGAFFGTNYPQKTPGKITRFTFGRFLTLAVFGHILKSKSRSERVWISTWESNDSVANREKYREIVINW